LNAGVSSRAQASVISGRGVGLDIVRSVMVRMRGSVHLAWEAGEGTTVRLEFPSSLASVRALLVSIGPRTFALPTPLIRRIVKFQVGSLGSLEGQAVLGDPEGPIRIFSLARILGPPLLERPLTDVARAVVMEGSGVRAAFVVDDVLAEEELVLRPVPLGNRSLPLVAGAAILGHGGVAPIVDAAALLANISG